MHYTCLLASLLLLLLWGPTGLPIPLLLLLRLILPVIVRKAECKVVVG